uniref:Coiled-coil and C2 domain-containing protein 2A-like n=1 Tax=Diabrotica virgifera virgifera TaxID=50390 RepID=A0A6P7GYL8_DIAVI
MVVPNRVREIPVTILNPYMRRKASEEKGYISDDDDTEYKAQYNFGKKRLKQVYLRVFHLCKNTENNLDYESVVNENYFIYFHSSHSDYLNPNSLEGIISVNIYDESNIEIEKLNKKCVNWLGGVDILLSAVCCLDSMSGYFQIKVPYLLLDYEDEAETTSQNKSPKLISSSSNRSYLYLEVFLEPNIPKLAPNMEELKSAEVPYIQEHVLKWNKIFNNSYAHRKFNALVLDTNGKTTCITRYIKALEPPQINHKEFDVTVEQCLRYISLIPFTERNHFYSNIWLGADQLISFMLGSITDHCIALTCYLLALKVEAWLLLGYGIPHGYTAYVLVQEHSAESPLPLYYVLDVFYNEKYNVLDEHCPLQKIFCVLNGTN